MFVSRKTFAVAVACLVLGLSAIGCSYGTPPLMLDSSATVTLQGQPIVRQVPCDGEMSVFDINPQRIVFTGRVKKDEVVTVDPTSRQITINGEIAADDLRGGNQFRISFDAGL